MLFTALKDISYNISTGISYDVSTQLPGIYRKVVRQLTIAKGETVKNKWERKQSLCNTTLSKLDER